MLIPHTRLRARLAANPQTTTIQTSVVKEQAGPHGGRQNYKGCELDSGRVRATSEDVLAGASPDPTCRSRKEVIQPQVPLRLPCYDFTPVTSHSLKSALLAVRQPVSGATDSHGVTGGVYKARERIHPCLLIRDY